MWIVVFDFFTTSKTCIAVLLCFLAHLRVISRFISASIGETILPNGMGSPPGLCRHALLHTEFDITRDRGGNLNIHPPWKTRWELCSPSAR
jgi:hypothetical protein